MSTKGVQFYCWLLNDQKSVGKMSTKGVSFFVDFQMTENPTEKIADKKCSILLSTSNGETIVVVNTNSFWHNC
jgi:hypothetical protein